MSYQGLEIIAFRNRFYEDNYRQMQVIVVMLFIIICELLGFVYYQYVTRPAPVYFPTTSDGRSIHSPPLSDNYLRDDEVISWATRAVTLSYSFDFINYGRALEDARLNFTKKGYEDFLKALLGSNNMDLVKARKQVVTTQIVGDVKLVDSGLYDDRYSWQLKIPMIAYQGSDEKVQPTIQQKLLATIRIVRMNTLEAISGVAIHQLVFEVVNS